MVNLKSKYRPIIIAKPGTKFGTFSCEVRKEFSHFPWWNHWPVARIASDGRYAMTNDQPAHSSLSWVTQPEGAFLYGMTDQPALGVLPMARAWIAPAALKVTGNAFASNGYSQSQRAYLLKRLDKGITLNLELAGCPASPVVNPPLVIQNWGDHEATLTVDGLEVPRGKTFRYGLRRTLEGTDLIVWIKTTAEKPLRISIAARN